MRDVIIDTERSRLFSYGFLRHGVHWKGLRWNEKLVTVAQWQRERTEGASMLGLSYPLLLRNREKGYDPSKRFDYKAPVWEFTGYGRKQGAFHFAVGSPSATLAGKSEGGVDRLSGPSARLYGNGFGLVRSAQSRKIIINSSRAQQGWATGP